MNKLTVTAKGQVTLRKDVLQHLGVHPGDKIALEKLPNGRVEVRSARSTGRISDVFNSLKKKGSRTLSLDEINRLAAQGWARKR